MKTEIAKMGKRGTVVIPAALRDQFGLEEGDLMLAENHGDGILLRRAIALPMENYTLERQAEFVLSNAINREDYEAAKKTVRQMGLDPNLIHHYPLNDD